MPPSTDPKKAFDKHCREREKARKEGEEKVVEKKTTEVEITVSKEKIAELQMKEDNLKEELRTTVQQKRDANSSQEKIEDRLVEIEVKLTELDAQQVDYDGKGPALKQAYIDWENTEAPPRKSTGLRRLQDPQSTQDSNLGGTIHLHSLGDIHGWAPGLINWLRDSSLALCKIGENTLNYENNLASYREIFPDERERYKKGLERFGLPAWPHASPFFDEAMPTDLWGIEARLIAGHNDLFIQIGDMVDRADHSEVVIELMRRLIWRAKGSFFVLMGNHEQMILENDFDKWLNIERRASFSAGGSPGHHRFNALRNTYEGVNDQEARGKLEHDSFTSLRAHLAHLLLTQELIIRESLEPNSLERWKSMTAPALEEAGISEERLRVIATSSGWGGLEDSLEWINGLSGEVALPGALGCMRVRGKVFTHAEPTGLEELSKRPDFSSLMEPFSFDNGLSASITILNLPMGEDPTAESSSPALLWDRRTWQGGALKEDAKATIQEIVKRFEPFSVHGFVHGHSARQGIESKSLQSGIAITNIDESITPQYLHSTGIDDPYDLRKTPSGWNKYSHTSRLELELYDSATVNRSSEAHGERMIYEIESGNSESFSRYCRAIKVESEYGSVRISSDPRGESFELREALPDLDDLTLLASIIERKKGRADRGDPEHAPVEAALGLSLDDADELFNGILDHGGGRSKLLASDKREVERKAVSKKKKWKPEIQTTTGLPIGMVYQTNLQHTDLHALSKKYDLYYEDRPIAKISQCKNRSDEV